MHILSLTPAVHMPGELEAGTVRLMAEAASAFFASLGPDQQARGWFPLESPERLNWDYRPGERFGLSLKELSSAQRQLAYVLLASGLSRRGYSRAMAIMALESVLRRLEGRQGRHLRDSYLYYLTLFGFPGPHWGWRLDGHHLSVNFLIVGGNRVAPTPNFFGVNPGRVPEGMALAGLRVLAAEEDLARRLLNSLEAGRRNRAVIAPAAPGDIVTGTARRVRLEAPEGLSFAAMSKDQQRFFQDLVVEYTSRMPPDVAESQLHRIDQEGWGYLHFAWAGAAEPGQPHYYRVHGPSFLVEYDNTQNQANHIHTVWRDLQDDWGDDLLRQHYAKSHAETAKA